MTRLTSMSRRPTAARGTRLAAASLTALIAGLALAGPAAAVLPGRNGRIAFTSGRTAGDPTAQIFLRSSVLAPATPAMPITPLGGQSRHASWSPDRTKLVFANGTPGTPLTEDYDLFVKDMVTGSITPLDATEVGDSLSSDHAAWSPDGTRIAYEHQPTDNSAERDIMVKTVGTAAPAASLTTGAPVEFKPAWSPDSATIYYARTTALPNPNFDIVSRPAGGGTETPVANASGVDEYQPSISPDGSKICFTLQTTPGNPATADVYTASLPGLTGLTNLSNDATKGDINCTWSPDGTKIAYVNGVFSAGALVMKKADDPVSAPVPLEDDPGSNDFDGNPDWAPDGSPDCPDGAVTTRPGTPVTITLECTDTGPAYERTDPSGFIANDGGPLHGTTSDSAPTANPSTVVYTPTPGFTGTDRIVYSSFDDFGFGTDRGTITIDVRAPDVGGGPGGGAGGATATCAGRRATIVGTPGRDRLRGTARADVIAALGGNDTITGAGGNDVVCAGPGNDVASGGTGRDRLIGGTGRDRLSGGPGNDTLAGQAGRDRLFGGPGRDRLLGGADADRLVGGPGRDRLLGGPGRDSLTP